MMNNYFCDLYKSNTDENGCKVCSADCNTFTKCRNIIIIENCPFCGSPAEMIGIWEEHMFGCSNCNTWKYSIEEWNQRKNIETGCEGILIKKG